jgi:hypothetical protein
MALQVVTWGLTTTMYSMTSVSSSSGSISTLLRQKKSPRSQGERGGSRGG